MRTSALVMRVFYQIKSQAFQGLTSIRKTIKVSLTMILMIMTMMTIVVMTIMILIWRNKTLSTIE